MVTFFVTGSALIFALGSTDSAAFVTLRAQPPQVMFSMWNRMGVSFCASGAALDAAST